MIILHFMFCVTFRTMLFVEKSRELNLFLIKIRSFNKQTSTTIKFTLKLLIWPSMLNLV